MVLPARPLALARAETRSAYPFLRSSGKAEEIIRGSGLNFTILKSAAVYGPEDWLTNWLAGVQSGLPLVMPEPPPPPVPREESVAFTLGDGDIEDLAMPPPAAAPPSRQTAGGVRPLAQPMALSVPEELHEGDLEVPEIPEDEPTKVGTPSPAELERARQEGLAMLREREREEARAAAAAAPPPPPPPIQLAVPAPPAGSFGGTAPGHGFGTIDLDVAVPVAPAARGAGPVGSTTAPLQAAVGTTTAPLQAVGAAGSTTQKLVTSRPPPAPLPMSAPPPPVLVDVTPLTLAVETVEGYCDSIIARNTTVPCARTRL